MLCVYFLEMKKPQSTVLTVVLVVGISLSWILLKCGLDYNKAYQTSKLSKEVERTCLLIESAIDQYVESNMCLPATLKELNLENLPIPIGQFGYVNNTNECVIAFRDSTGFSTYRPRYYKGLAGKTNIGTNATPH